MAEVEFERRGGLGVVTLNRPEALNALTHGMVVALSEQLAAWAADPQITAVAIRGAGDRAFCAGGDIRALYEAGRPGGARGEANFAFYADEYRLNAQIKRYPKPYFALMDGIVMGGGVGVSVHGNVRIATPRTVFAMPETGIGLFPDVGGTWFLPRLPGETGMWLALTGARLKGAHCVAAGICDRLVDSIDPLLDDIVLGRAGAPHSAEAGSNLLPVDLIDRCFAGDSVDAILAALDASDTDWTRAQAEAIRAKSPLCTEIAFRQIRLGATLSFENAMQLEYRLARFCMTRPDFYEGVRAAIIDKDGAPAWSPASRAAIDPALIDAAFADDGVPLAL
ncbi:MAG: enoyl-CoA hydratase/isomerase family protein [Pikeienuella sp.]